MEEKEIYLPIYSETNVNLIAKPDKNITKKENYKQTINQFPHENILNF